jgi:hypothetical protein
MSNTFTLNQAFPTAIKGSDVTGYNQNNIDGIINPASTSTIYGGTALKIVGSSGGVTMYDKAATTDAIAGFARYNRINNTYFPGSTVSVAYDLSFMYMEASGTIAAGAEVEIVASGDTIVTSGGTNTVVGIARTAAVSGSIIPVEIKFKL